MVEEQVAFVIAEGVKDQPAPQGARAVALAQADLEARTKGPRDQAAMLAHQGQALQGQEGKPQAQEKEVRRREAAAAQRADELARAQKDLKEREARREGQLQAQLQEVQAIRGNLVALRARV